MRDYWFECIAEAFDDTGIVATKEQISNVAGWVEGAHENYGMAHGYDCIPNPTQIENKRLSKELELERSKVVCPECNGKRRLVTYGPYHSSDSECWKCRGEGKVLP